MHVNDFTLSPLLNGEEPKYVKRVYQDQERLNQVLIGSPGVGKSVVLFLYALHRAQGGKKVMYWRKARVDKGGISLFCMEPISLADVEEGVRIQFTTDIPWEKNINDIYEKYMRKAFPDLYQDVQDEDEAEALTVQLLRNEVLMFADGPRYEDNKDTKDGSIHFLCTSGGHPGPKNDEWTSMKVVVMTGWKKSPHADALKRYAKEDVVEKIWETEIWGEEQEQEKEKGGPTDMDVDADNDVPSNEEKLEEVVDLVYYYTGGRIRDALKIVKGAITIEGFVNYLSASSQVPSFFSRLFFLHPCRAFLLLHRVLTDPLQSRHDDDDSQITVGRII